MDLDLAGCCTINSWATSTLLTVPSYVLSSCSYFLYCLHKVLPKHHICPTDEGSQGPANRRCLLVLIGHHFKLSPVGELHYRLPVLCVPPFKNCV